MSPPSVHDLVALLLGSGNLTQKGTGWGYGDQEFVQMMQVCSYVVRGRLAFSCALAFLQLAFRALQYVVREDIRRSSTASLLW